MSNYPNRVETQNFELEKISQFYTEYYQIIWVIGYLLSVLLIAIARKNSSVAVFVANLLYVTVGFPFWILGLIIRLRKVFKRDGSTIASNPPTVVIDNPEVQIVNIRKIRSGTWSMTVRTRANASTSQRQIFESGGGNGSVNGENYNFTVYANN